MALTPAVTPLNRTMTRVNVGNHVWCFGVLAFGGADTYATGGFDISALIRKTFGVSSVHALIFMQPGSDGAGGGLSAGMIGRWIFTPAFGSTTESTVVKLFQIGRGSGGATPASETEVANGTSINACVLEFLAFAIEGGATVDSKGLNN